MGKLSLIAVGPMKKIHSNSQFRRNCRQMNCDGNDLIYYPLNSEILMPHFTFLGAGKHT